MLTNQATCNPAASLMFGIISERVFGNVSMQVFRGNRMVNTDKRHLEQTEKPFGRINVSADSILGFRVFARRVINPQVVFHLAAEPVIGGEFVGAEDRCAVEPSVHQRVERYRPSRAHHGCPGVAAALDRREHHRLIGAASATGRRPVFLPVPSLTSDVGFVGLDDASKLQIFPAFEHRPDAVHQVPARSVLDVELPRQAHRTERLGGSSVGDFAHRRGLVEVGSAFPRPIGEPCVEDSSRASPVAA